MGEVRNFFFQGEIPASKSLLIRALLLQAYQPGLSIEGSSGCEDVLSMKRTLTAVARGATEIPCGEAGLVFRLMLAFVSRRSGDFLLTGSPRLLSRPHDPLTGALRTLGVEIESETRGFRVRSKGWVPRRLKLDPSGSSQYLSALVLNAWDLPSELQIELVGEQRSVGYSEMSEALARELGMEIVREGRILKIAPSQTPQVKTLRAESDLSSAFAVAALAAVSGKAEFLHFPENSAQPDRAFVSILERMGVPLVRERGTLKVSRASSFRSIDENLGECPDLFPVLSVLAALAPGRSRLWGAPQLRAKESDRIEEAAKIVEAIGRSVEQRDDGIVIDGQCAPVSGMLNFAHPDHRLVMAAAVARWAGHDIRVGRIEAVRKSFPEFLRIAELEPHFVIGHRGVGKTSFLNRVGFYLKALGREPALLDLDREIERRAGKTVQRIFDEDGESAFRKLEKETLEAIIQPSAWISVGAGFEGEFPKASKVLWLRRNTDSSGRVFLDRPRLDARVSPWEEFRERFPARERRYERLADRSWWMGEGWDQPSSIEKEFLFGGENEVGGVFCVLPKHLATLSDRLSWKGTRFELRDDLLTEVEIEQALAVVPAERVVYSFRKSAPRALPYWTDCPLELGDVSGPKVIRSLHERRSGQSVEDCIRRIEGAGVLKLSIEIATFEELETGHRWMMADPKHRSFLPRSMEDSSGRWGWYRAWTSVFAPISFLREDEGSSPDQPTYLEWMRRRLPSNATSFAAVLGDPVSQSRTPAEHFEYFKDAPVFAIRLTEADWDAGALDVLARMGLRYAAVTAPLKEKAAKACGVATPLNTLFFDGRNWKGRNTDIAGFKKLAGEIPAGASVAVWGGGGTLEAIRESVPQARFYSARTGLDREAGAASFSPRVVIWAVGRSRKTDAPPREWKPELILDLNYAEDSPGREYALLTGARYVSGLAMFQAQAQGQREFWNECK